MHWDAYCSRNLSLSTFLIVPPGAPGGITTPAGKTPIQFQLLEFIIQQPIVQGLRCVRLWASLELHSMECWVRLLGVRRVRNMDIDQFRKIARFPVNTPARMSHPIVPSPCSVSLYPSEVPRQKNASFVALVSSSTRCCGMCRWSCEHAPFPARHRRVNTVGVSIGCYMCHMVVRRSIVSVMCGYVSIGSRRNTDGGRFVRSPKYTLCGDVQL